MLGPAQITGVYEHFDPLLDGEVATAGDLPSTGNWNGRQAFIADTKTQAVWDGTEWLRFDTDWISYTPTRVGNSGGTLTGKYFRSGKKVDVQIRMVGGAISANNPSFTLPFNAADANVQWLPGTVLMRDDSASTELFGITRKMTVSTVSPYVLSASTTYAQFASVGTGVPFTWAASDVLEMAFSYEIP